MKSLFCWPLADTCEVWWDQPEEAPPGAVYRVLLDGEAAGDARRTHATLTGLQPGSAHTASVLMGDKPLGEIAFRTTARPKVHDARALGAAGDGKTLDTAALQRAIDLCGPGEEVFLPAGVYRTGALDLHSGMTLRLAEGAVLQGTADPADYLPKIPSRFEGIECACYRSLLNLGRMDHAAGPNARDVVLCGGGEICGGGQPLAQAVMDAEQKRLEAYIRSLGEGIRAYENEHTIAGRARGRLINLSNCEHVRITGLTLKNGASWNVHMLYSRDIVTDHCVFRSEDVWNGDGWDPDSSEDCTLFASEFHTGDDAVAVKSGKNPEGNRIARPTRRIRVFDCASERGHGVAIGSEMSGGVEDVRIWDCDLEHSLYGVLIKGTKKRGGFIRRVRVRDSVLSRFQVCAVKYNDDGEGATEPPVFEDLTCERVRFTGWARDYWETEDHSVPCIDCAGFDVPGHEAARLSFVDCAVPENAAIRLEHVRGVAVRLTAAEKN